MVKLFSTEHTFHHPFERVTSAFWRKYPNEAASHVKAIDITDRRIDEQGRLITNRLMSCQSSLPSWACAAGLPQRCYVAESSIVDPANKQMVVKSQNLSGASLMVVEETCTYKQCPINPSLHTVYKQEARITAFLPFISGKFESYSFQNIQSKSKEGMAVVENLCQRIQRDGVLSLLHGSPSSSSSSSSSAAAAVTAAAAAATVKQ